MGLYSCLVLELFCFKQKHLLIRIKHSLMPCTKSEDTLWTKPTKSRRSCMHRPHSWPILVPTAAQSKKKRKEMEEKFLHNLPAFCTSLPPHCFFCLTDANTVPCAAVERQTSFCVQKATFHKAGFCRSARVHKLLFKRSALETLKHLPLARRKIK